MLHGELTWTHALTLVRKHTHLISHQTFSLHADSHKHTEQMLATRHGLRFSMTCSFHRNQLSQWRANAFYGRKGRDIHYKCDLYSAFQCSHLPQLLSNNSKQQKPPSTTKFTGLLRQFKPSTNMHAFSKLMPLGLSALALALPSQVQERAGTPFTDTV